MCEDSGGEVVRGYLGAPISYRRSSKDQRSGCGASRNSINEQQKIQDQLHVILILSDQARPVTGHTLSVNELLVRRRSSWFRHLHEKPLTLFVQAIHDSSDWLGIS